MAKSRGRTGRRRASEPASGSPLTAQAIVRAASGKALRGSDPITTRTLAEHLPSRDDAAAAQAAFRAAGFEVGALGGISFSITAPKSHFEQFFGVRMDVDENGVVRIAGRKSSDASLELPLQALPPELSGRLEAVAFEAPADIHDGQGSALF